MNIAFFVGSFPAVSETFILQQITGLIDLGHDVDIYCEVPPSTDTPFHPEVLNYNLLKKTCYMSDHIPEETFPWEMPMLPVSGETWLPGREHPIQNSKRVEDAAPHLIKSLLKAPHLAFEALDPTEYGISANSFSAIYKLSILSCVEKKYDVLHAHFGPYANTFRFTRDLWKAPFIATFHGYDMCTVPRKEGKDVYKNLFRKVDIVTIHSEYARKRLEQLNCPSSKLCKLRVGINLRDFAFQARIVKTAEKVRILSVARLVEIKGLDYSITAIAEVVKKFPDVQYDIIGEGPERAKLENIIEREGLEKIVTLHGAQNSNYVKQMMAQAHLFILPSINLLGDEEGTPVCLMEAQACGIPVVATNTGGIPEVILDGESGFLFPDKDPVSLAILVSHLIENSQQWPQLGQSGRRHIEENYDISKLNNQLVDIYNEAINNYYN